MNRHLTVAWRAFAIVGSAMLLGTSAFAIGPVRAKAPKRLSMKTVQPKSPDLTYEFALFRVTGSGDGLMQLVDINNRGTVSIIFTTFDPTTGVVAKAITAIGDAYSILADYRRGVPSDWARFAKIEHPVGPSGDPVTFTGMIAADNGLLFGNWGDINRQHAAIYDPVTRKWTELPDIANKTINIGLRLNEAGVGLGAACEGDFFTGVTNCDTWTFDTRTRRYTFYGPTWVQANYGGISNRGDFVTTIEGTDGYPHPVLAQVGGEIMSLPNGPSPGAIAADMTDAGRILLLSFSSGQWAFWDHGAESVLPVIPGFDFTDYLGVNDHLDLVGTAWTVSPDGMYYIPQPCIAIRD